MVCTCSDSWGVDGCFVHRCPPAAAEEQKIRAEVAELRAECRRLAEDCAGRPSAELHAAAVEEQRIRAESAEARVESLRVAAAEIVNDILGGMRDYSAQGMQLPVEYEVPPSTNKRLRIELAKLLALFKEP